MERLITPPKTAVRRFAAAPTRPHLRVAVNTRQSHREFHTGGPMSVPTKQIRVLLASCVIAMTASWPALAETDAERQACTNDAQVHCADQIPDRDQVYACLI